VRWDTLFVRVFGLDGLLFLFVVCFDCLFVCLLFSSLCVVMLEITNDLQNLPPIMLTVMCAKIVGDWFTPPLYDAVMQLKYLPFVEAEPIIEMERMVTHTTRSRTLLSGRSIGLISPGVCCWCCVLHVCCRCQTASDVMVRDVKYLPSMVEVGAIMKLLYTCTHNGFPVVDPGPGGNGRTLRGLILRKQLYVLIKQRAWTANHVRPLPSHSRLLRLAFPFAFSLVCHPVTSF
jgi:chloride channel 7